MNLLRVRRHVAFVFKTWLLFRSALLFLMYFARTQFPNSIRLQGKGFLHAFTAWDGRWYHDIVKHGYSYTPGRESNVAFFPAYPYSVRALCKLAGALGWDSIANDDFLVGVVLSNVLFVLALLLLYAWVLEEAGEQSARRAVRWALVLPSTHFFSSFYTESMYLFAVCGAFYAWRTRRPWLFMPFGFLAGCTRSSGIILVGAMFLGELVRFIQEPSQRKRILLWSPAWLAPAVGLGAYMVHLQHEVGDPFAFSKTMAAWGRHWDFPWNGILNEFQHPLEAYRQFEACLTIALLPLAVYALLRLKLVYGSFFLVSTLLATSTHMTASVLRYTVGTGVVFLLFASFGEKRERELMPIFALLAGFAATCFAGGYWAG